MKRQRHVYPTRDIPGLWFNKTQYSARNPQGNLFFEGDILYSYRRSFPIAMHVTNARGESAILITTDKYSHTTACHIGSIPLHKRTYHIDLQHSFGNGALTQYKAKIERLIALAKRARENKPLLIKRIDRLAEEARSYAEFWDIEPLPTYDLRELRLAALKYKSEVQVKDYILASENRGGSHV
jgi:hypothetical protein